MLRILHTADWHLGHSLHELSRDKEHSAFLDWLLDQLEAHAVDALLIAGDIFDTANPPTRAMRAWFDFLRRARMRCPQLDIVVSGGNHDSPARLEAAVPVLDALGIHVVGVLPRNASGEIDADRLVVPLHDASGNCAAWCMAVPFLRTADLPRNVELSELDGGDVLIAGVRAVYTRALEIAHEKRQAGEALVAMGHAYMVGGALSELSERQVLGGNQHALPVDIFSEDTDYVALGHLHRAQAVGSRNGVRYSGSPIPLAIDEDTYPHQVLLADVEAGQHVGIQELLVPRSIDIRRIPGKDGADWATVSAALNALPASSDDGARDRWPYLEVRVRIDGPRPSLRREVEAIISDKAVRLVKLIAMREGEGGALAQAVEARELADLRPHEVLGRKWERDYGGTPPDPVLACFHELVDELGQTAGGAA